MILNPIPWKRLAQEGDFENAIVEYCTANPYTTFSRLQNVFAAYLPTDGGFRIHHHRFVFWAGMSDEFSQIVDELIRQQRIHLHPVLVIFYLMAAGVSLVDLEPNEIWVPTVLRHFPFDPEVQHGQI